MSGAYELLSAHFDKHQTRKQGGTDLTYLTGEQVLSRLNEVLGVTGWSFRVVREGATEIEAWVLGELSATINGETVIRQHYGNQELMRGQRPTGDLFKSAATDAIKKCATTIGIGLYLYDADERREVEAEMKRPTPIRPPSRPEPMDDEQARASRLVGKPPTFPDDRLRDEARAEYRRLVTLAVVHKHPRAADIEAKRAEDLDDARLVGSVRALQAWVAANVPAEPREQAF
jgi:recombination DNA repair RAD52 pathway protein